MTLVEVLEVFRERLGRDGAPAAAIEAFEAMYRSYRGGVEGKVAWGEIRPAEAEDLVAPGAFDSPRSRRAGEAWLDRVVWIVLNGGLGTSMRMERAKSLVPVKGDATFLDLIARHVAGWNERRGGRLPLVFMNSFATREDTLEALEGAPRAAVGGPDGDLPVDFLQQRFPRIRAADGQPFGDPADKDAWAPPGHGNLYLALRCSGLLDELLRRGMRWAFVSNADNLGAAPDAGILGYLAEHGLDFALEVTPRTPADVKGGTLVRRAGRLELLEIAQVPDGHAEDFQDVRRFPVFNTNNLWLDLEALRGVMERGGPSLPLIVNRKVVRGHAVVQLESAMGAALGSFARPAGMLVPRSRFAPVKTVDDLVVRRSDLYRVGESAPLEPDPARDPALGPPLLRLDPRYYGSVADLNERLPHPLGLLQARALEVRGDVRFGRGVNIVGEVSLEGPLRVADGTVLGG